MRLASGQGIDWVTFQSFSGHNIIKFEPTTKTEAKSYVITFESFDNNGTVKSALKTDKITVTVTPPTAVSQASVACVLDAKKDKVMQVVLD